MPGGITVFVDGLSATVQVPTADAVRILNLFYAAKGGNPDVPQAQRLQPIAQMVGKYVVDVAEDAKRAEYQRQADIDSAADTLPEWGG